MYRIVDKKGMGKTGRLLLLAKENDGIVVCANPIKTREQAHHYGLTGINYISYTDYFKCLCGYANDELLANRKIFIDEIDVFLSLCNSDIAGYTLSLE
jgi:hypothetical protein